MGAGQTEGCSEKYTLGLGLGLRQTHYDFILENRPSISWFEAIAENFMGIEGANGGRPLQILQEIRQNYPVVLHGVSLNIGSVDPVDLNYLSKLKELHERIEPVWISDHLCWTGVDSVNLHDLLPLPYTEEALDHVSKKLQFVQEYLKRQILLENVSSYLTYCASEMPEWEFLAEISRRAGCRILLDINNIYVSSVNHGFDPMVYLQAIPVGRVGQIHVAGHTDNGDHLMDTHDQEVIEPVWRLYEAAILRFGTVPTLLERDDNIPPFPLLEEELKKARFIQEKHSAEDRIRGQPSKYPALDAMDY